MCGRSLPVPRNIKAIGFFSRHVLKKYPPYETLIIISFCFFYPIIDSL